MFNRVGIRKAFSARLEKKPQQLVLIDVAKAAIAVKPKEGHSEK